MNPTRRSLLGSLLALFVPASMKREEPKPLVGRSVPIGTIQQFFGDKPPGFGWIPCDGRILYVAQFPELHAVIGSAYSKGVIRVPHHQNPRWKWFSIPDLRQYTKTEERPRTDICSGVTVIAVSTRHYIFAGRPDGRETV